MRAKRSAVVFSAVITPTLGGGAIIRDENHYEIGKGSRRHREGSMG